METEKPLQWGGGRTIRILLIWSRSAGKLPFFLQLMCRSVQNRSLISWAFEIQDNFYDIIRLNSNLYITTNYDLCLEEFLSHTVGYRAPLCLRDIDNLRTLLEESSQVLHIHGHIKRKDTMIVSQEDYKKLYEDSALMFKVNSILANRPLLYIGFSFTDKFFVDLYTKLGKIVKNHHYIVIANPDLETAREFNKKNIKVVGLRVAETPDGETDYNDFIMAFRTLVNYLVK